MAMTINWGWSFYTVVILSDGTDRIWQERPELPVVFLSHSPADTISLLQHPTLQQVLVITSNLQEKNLLGLLNSKAFHPFAH